MRQVGSCFCKHQPTLTKHHQRIRQRLQQSVACRTDHNTTYGACTCLAGSLCIRWATKGRQRSRAAIAGSGQARVGHRICNTLKNAYAFYGSYKFNKVQNKRFALQQDFAEMPSLDGWGCCLWGAGRRPNTPRGRKNAASTRGEPRGSQVFRCHAPRRAGPVPRGGSRGVALTGRAAAVRAAVRRAALSVPPCGASRGAPGCWPPCCGHHGSPGQGSPPNHPNTRFLLG